MGIRGLTQFVKDIPEVWTSMHLSDSRLIIDGDNLLFHLHIASGLDMRYGGQYLEYYQIIRLFFSTLKKNQIEAVVILDGVEEGDLKLPTIRNRASDRIKEAQMRGCVPPLFIVQVFCQAVIDSDVEIMVCDHEGDMVAAQMAKEQGCPVLSNDSDFYLFDVPSGVIPIDEFGWQQQEKSISISCQCYHRDEFLDRIELSAEFLPLLSVLVGNDLSNSDLLKPLHRYMNSVTGSVFRSSTKHGRIHCVINWLSQFDDVQLAEAHLPSHVLNSPGKLLSILQKSKPVTRTLDMTKSALKTVDGVLFPDWVVQSFRVTEFAKVAVQAACHGRILMHVQMEDMRRPNAHTCSTPIRQAVYSILFKGRVHSPIEMIEICRNDGVVGLHDRRVKILTESHLPSLNEIQSLSVKERHDMLLTTLSCDPNEFTKLDLNWRLPTAAVLFWSHLKDHYLPNKAVYAIVFCFTSCARELDGLRKASHHFSIPRSPRKPKGELDIQLAHSFAEFQSILYYAMVLNSVLGFPFPSVDVAGLFNGRLAHYSASKYHGYKDFLDASEQSDLFETICQLVDRQKDIVDAAPLPVKSKQKKKYISPKAVSPVSGSRFEFLGEDSDDFDVKTSPGMKPEAAGRGGIKKAGHQAMDCPKIGDSNDGDWITVEKKKKDKDKKYQSWGKAQRWN